jgi:DNA-binding HxlR family transcriptional regulator
MKNTQSSTCEETICPIQKLAEILSDAWTILILRDVLISPMRFSELEKSLVGISTRTLTLKLQKLVEEGILSHTDCYYSITKKGEKLRSVIDEIGKVGKKF